MGLGATDVQATSYINGMQATILISELIKNNFGLGARWLLLSGTTQMFYGGSDSNYLYHPHPDFYYLYYLQKFYGDHEFLLLHQITIFFVMPQNIHPVKPA